MSQSQLWRTGATINTIRHGLPGAHLGPVGLVLVAIASVQFGAVFAKGIFPLAHPLGLALLRALIASLVLLLIARPQFKGRSLKDWGLVVAYGLCLSGMNLLIYLSFATIPVGVAVTLEFVGPLTVALLGSRRRLDLLWVALAGTGVVLLGSAPLGVDWLGIAFALGAGALWGAYIALAGPVARAWPGATGLTVGSLVGAVALAIPGAAVAGPALSNPTVWSVMAAVALLSTVVPYALELRARRNLSAPTFGILMSLEPAAAALFGWLVLGELLDWRQWLAMAAVIVASVGTICAKPLGDKDKGKGEPTLDDRPAS